ncbi:MAG: 3D domain-containing protein [Moorellales bacterium]
MLVAAIALGILGVVTVGLDLAGAVGDAEDFVRLIRVEPVPVRGRPEPTSRSEEVRCEGRTDLVQVRLGGGIDMEVLATAYAPGDDGVDGITATGLPVDRGVVAVDPRIIPLGSVVYVPGYGYALACDVGGAIRGRRVDVYFADRSEAIAWGIRRVRVTVYSGGGGGE